MEFIRGKSYKRKELHDHLWWKIDNLEFVHVVIIQSFSFFPEVLVVSTDMKMGGIMRIYSDIVVKDKLEIWNLQGGIGRF